MTRPVLPAVSRRPTTVFATLDGALRSHQRAASMTAARSTPAPLALKDADKQALSEWTLALRDAVAKVAIQPRGQLVVPFSN